MYGQSFFQPGPPPPQPGLPVQSSFNSSGPSGLHSSWNDRGSTSGLLQGMEMEMPRADSPEITPKRGVGGRPRDKVWEMFEGDREMARCRYCQWKTDHPKAFRMRQHVAVCDAVPSDKKIEMENYLAEKEDKKQMKEEASTNAAPVQSAPKKVKRDPPTPVKMAPLLRSPITCHVLDSTSGKPAPEMRVRLDRLTATGFEALSQALTDIDGRVGTLLPAGAKLDAGIYKITFFTQDYFTKRGINSFYPFVEIPFDVKAVEEHYHVPLLLSPYAYSTYRGS